VLWIVIDISTSSAKRRQNPKATKQKIPALKILKLKLN
jgi:hypothetical protein